MSKWSYDATRTGYAKLWDSIKIKSTDAANAARFAKKILAGETNYREVQDTTGVPWYFIGALHMRESSCNFDGVLHNGEKIVGTRKKTRLVPAGRGPFPTWEDAAVDALQLKHLDRYSDKWCPALMGYAAETYNGLGYVGHKTNSPYVWAGSNHEQTGKYVADHVWDKDFDDPQIGVLTVIKVLANLRPDIAAELAENHVSPPVRKPAPAPVVVEEPVVDDEVFEDEQDDKPVVVKKPMTTKNKVIVAGSVAGGTGGAVAGGASYFDQLQPIIDIFQNYGSTIAMTFTVACIIGAVGFYFYERSQNAKAGA